MPKPKPTRLVDLAYSPMHVPAGCRTRNDWLRDGFRVVGDHAAQLLVLHDRQHSRRRSPEEPLPPEEVAALRSRLRDDEHPSDEDRRLVARLDASCQATWCNLYPPEVAEPIITPTQAEAWDLLSGLWRMGSHPTQFIFGGQDEETGRKWCFTAGGKIDKTWDILDHKKGDRYLGVKRGGSTRVIDIDLDRHSGAVSASDQVHRVLATLQWLQEHMPWAAPHISNINPRNGSCHVTLYLPRAIPVEQARTVVADIRSACPWLREAEVYPDNMCQFILPLRRDKVTVIDRVLTPTVKSRRYERVPGVARKKNGRRPRGLRRDYLAMDASAYWSWIADEGRKPCDLALVERELRKACAATPDAACDIGKAARKNKGDVAERPAKSKPDRREAGLNLKGRCAQVLVDFLRGGDGDARPMAAVMLRVLHNAEGMERDQGVARTAELLALRPDFQEKPVEERPRLSKMIEKASVAIWEDNGWQRDPVGSLRIWAKVKAAWDRRGFKLSDPSTWGRAGGAVVDDDSDLVWTPGVVALLPGLAEEARCDLERARKLLRSAGVHVGRKAELSLSFLARLMAAAGIAAYRDNVVRVRKFLESHGVIVLRKRGFRWGSDTGVGNCYTLGMAVEVVGAGQGGLAGLPPQEEGEEEETSTNPSLTRLDVSSLVEQRRLKACLDHYYERVRAVGGGTRLAA